MTDTPTPRSASESGSLKRPKDRNCPFCEQPFTSSSLGRHLDLYIKEDKPKAPDGIHDVEQIKQLRGNITRRQAKAQSLKRREMKQNSVAQTTPQQALPDLDQAIAPVSVSSNLRSLNGKKVVFNQPNWLATGVINNLPPRVDSAVRRALQPDVSHNMKMAANYATTPGLPNDSEDSHAAELALRDLLRTLQQARRRTTPDPFFAFDPFSLNFPGLCLRILPAPPTINSPTPFPTNDSWFLNPPNEKEFIALRKNIQERYTKGQSQSQRTWESGDLDAQISKEPPVEELLSHLAAAYNHWNSLSSEMRQSTWQLELLRSFS
ncbi:hypothetical protein K402DRAFT_335708, partial [Aulographum hederae CBS 113979]